MRTNFLLIKVYFTVQTVNNLSWNKKKRKIENSTQCVALDQLSMIFPHFLDDLCFAWLGSIWYKIKYRIYKILNLKTRNRCDFQYFLLNILSIWKNASRRTQNIGQILMIDLNLRITMWKSNEDFDFKNFCGRFYPPLV